MTLPIFSGPAVLTSIVDIKGVMMPALKPCKRRKKMNRLIFQLNPTRTDVRPKARTERISTFLPSKRSISHPEIGTASASAKI